MQINSNFYSVSEIIEMLGRRELLVNQEYQRGSGLWPNGPSSYFIDTILEGFPFPKIYLYEYLTRPDRKLRKEIVDGQQRVNAILRFRNNQLRLGPESRHSGLTFDQLDEEVKDQFLTYPVSVDVIRNATTAEILQMFRRMNAYTLPLNEAEKRHSTFQGAFKWFVNALSDEINEFFVEYGVFATREIVRMADSEFISECVFGMERGLVSTSPTDLRRLYENYDGGFPHEEEYHDKIRASVQYIYEHFDTLRRTRMMKPYAAQTLVIALIHCRYGIPELEQQWHVPSLGRFSANAEAAAEALMALAQAHEAKELEGPYGKYVWGALGGTNREPRRRARMAAVLRALGADVPDAMDADLPR
ncbi:MAG: DUF262 domain-containing protein [Sphingomicrobium sp.]